MNIERALGIPGWMQQSELEWLATQAESKKFIIEVGCYVGRSTRAMADNTNGKIVVIDDFYGCREPGARHPNGDEYTDESRRGIIGDFRANLSDHLVSKKILILKTDYPNMARAVKGMKPDFVFIDGDHDYEAVVHDINLFGPMVVDGGILCGHDSNHPPVSQAIADTIGAVQYAPSTSIWYKAISRPAPSE